jgi:hypothetical protein
MPNEDFLKVETCSGRPLHSKRMVIYYYRFVFVYILKYYFCLDGPICDIIFDNLGVDIWLSFK